MVDVVLVTEPRLQICEIRNMPHLKASKKIGLFNDSGQKFTSLLQKDWLLLNFWYCCS